MARSLRIVVAEDDADMQAYFKNLLPGLGHKIVAFASTGQEMVEQSLKHRPDLVIADIIMPGMDGIDAAAEICKDATMPIILVSGYHDEELIERAESNHIMAYLSKPIRRTDLIATIAMAMHQFELFETLREEAKNLRQALEDRKIIERAKGALMKRTGWDEKTAFRRLQKLASEKNRKLIDIAHMVLLVEEAYEPTA